MKILLHACCGVCAAQTIKKLKEEFGEVFVYFYNPNIWPEKEYQKRLEAMKQVAQYHGTEFIEEKHNHQEWLEAVRGLEKEPEGGKRCAVCYKIRLEQTAQKSKELGCGLFATTLSISPHKKAEIINKIGRETGERFGAEFYEADFKKQDGFKKTCALAKQLNLYHQNYCGCEFGRPKSRIANL